MTQLSRNAQILRYLMEVAPGLGRIKLAKFAYLADCESYRYLDRSTWPRTNLSMVDMRRRPWWRRGPIKATSFNRRANRWSTDLIKPRRKSCATLLRSI